jgi:hypothetical protein
MGAIKSVAQKRTDPKVQGALQLNRTRCAICAIIAASVLAGCSIGLEAWPVDAAGRFDGSDRAPSAQPHSDLSSGIGEVGASSEQGLAIDPAGSAMLRAISRRAIHDVITEHRGFMPSIVAVSTGCENLQTDEDLEARLFCLQHDPAAWFVESTAPPAWQEMGPASIADVADERFSERRWREGPPCANKPEARLQKQALHNVLDAAAGAAIRDYVETIALGAIEEAAPPPSSQSSKPRS